MVEQLKKSNKIKYIEMFYIKLLISKMKTHCILLNKFSSTFKAKIILVRSHRLVFMYEHLILSH